MGFSIKDSAINLTAAAAAVFGVAGLANTFLQLEPAYAGFLANSIVPPLAVFAAGVFSHNDTQSGMSKNFATAAAMVALVGVAAAQAPHSLVATAISYGATAVAGGLALASNLTQNKHTAVPAR